MYKNFLLIPAMYNAVAYAENFHGGGSFSGIW